MKLRTRFHSRHATLTLAFGRSTQEFSTHGTLTAATIEMVCIYIRGTADWNSDRILRPLAALTMYQRARKLGNVISNNPDQFLTLAELQLEAYLVCINALSLIDPKSAWFVLPISAEGGNEVGACRDRLSVN